MPRLAKKARLRIHARTLIREFHAILTFTLALNPDAFAHINESLEELRTAGTKRLRDLVEEYEGYVDDMHGQLGAKYRAPADIIDLLEFTEKAPNDKVTMVPKFIVHELFSNAARCFTGDWPLHARYEMSPRPRTTQTVEIQLIETKFYESMASLYNLTRSAYLSLTERSSKIASKQLGAMQKATLAAALSFVESFVNGIGAEYCLEKGKSLSKDKMAFLTDTKERYVAFRDKLLQYPRVIIDAKHPPLQESNCPAMKIILDRSRVFRDALTHPKPGTSEPAAKMKGKEDVLFSFGFEEVEATVDSAITLVREIAKVIGYSDERMFWLVPRNDEGIFPDSAFD